MAAVLLSQGACVGSAEPEEAILETEESVIVHNALTFNALTFNALTFNGLTATSLLSNALTGSALMANPLTQAALEEPAAREVLEFITGCALPAGAHFDVEVDGVIYGYDGEIGLAPEWGKEGGECNDRCKAWVSACVLSRVNYLGEQIQISVRGSHPALSSTSEEQQTYAHREATYYGDIFVQPQRLYACLSPGETSIERVCGASIEDCAVDVVGSCSDVCARPRRDGSFSSCRDQAPDAAHVFPDGTELHNSAVTVFLQ